MIGFPTNSGSDATCRVQNCGMQPPNSAATQEYGAADASRATVPGGVVPFRVRLAPLTARSVGRQRLPTEGYPPDAAENKRSVSSKLERGRSSGLTWRGIWL